MADAASDWGEEGGTRLVMERMGTRAAAVPAAKTSVKLGSSEYLICGFDSS